MKKTNCKQPCGANLAFTAHGSCLHLRGIFHVGNQLCQYLVKITDIHVDITFIIPKLIDGVGHMPKELNGLSD